MSKRKPFRTARTRRIYKAFALRYMANVRRIKGKVTATDRKNLSTAWVFRRFSATHGLFCKLTYMRWAGKLDQTTKWDLSIKRFLAKKFRWPSTRDSHPTLQTRGDWLRIQREKAARGKPTCTDVVDFKTSSFSAGDISPPLAYRIKKAALGSRIGAPFSGLYGGTAVPALYKNAIREPSWVFIEDSIAELRPVLKLPTLRSQRFKNTDMMRSMSVLRQHPVEWLRFYRRWKTLWRTYSRILRRTGLYSRRVWIERGKVRVAWDYTGISTTLPLDGSSWRAVKTTPTGQGRQYYFRHLWNAILRLKFERFFFKNSGVRTYIWLHNIWAFTKKRLSRWPRFERKSMWRLTNFRNRFSLRRGLARLFLRTLGLFFSVPGTAHCFVHILTYLIRRFRRHWQLLKFVDGYLKLGRKVFLRHATVGYRIMISGKFTGKMRARKHIFGTGKIKFLMWEWPIDYTRADSFTRWGVFGISVWVQTRLKHRASRKFMGTSRKPIEGENSDAAFATEIPKHGSTILRKYRKKKQRLEQKRLKALEPPKEY